MKILRANTNTGTINYEDVPANWQRWGGRGLVARFLLDDVDATCDPLGPKNKLIWAPGLLVGHTLSSCDRISVGGKSPLTGGVKEANAGGTTGAKMVWLDLHSLIIEGGPPDDGSWKLLYIDADGARFETADDLVGLGLKDTALRLTERFHDRIGVSAIGQGGERLYLSAGISHIDKDRNLTRISARGGLGAVMGSKHLKAVVFDQVKRNPPSLYDEEGWKDASKRYIKALQEHPQTSQVYPDYGTAAMADLCNMMGGIPTRNFSSGRFENIERINGDTMHDVNKARGGDVAHACMPGCIIRCSNNFVDEDGESLVTPLEYETLGLMGSNLGIDDLDVIARMNDIANDLGVDTIEVGAALGVAADGGYMEFGDGKRALELMDEVQQGTPLGRVIGNGAVATGTILGVQRIPAVKGQAISAYDPRAIKGTGVTYATTPQGADHTAGLTIRAQIDHISPEGQVELSRGAQYNMAGYDTLGACVFGGFAFGTVPTVIPDLVRSRFGWDVEDDLLKTLGRETILLEREFNKRAGFTEADDRIPEWMTLENLPPHDTAFDVPGEEMDTVFDE